LAASINNLASATLPSSLPPPCRAPITLFCCSHPCCPGQMLAPTPQSPLPWPSLSSTIDHPCLPFHLPSHPPTFHLPQAHTALSPPPLAPFPCPSYMHSLAASPGLMQIRSNTLLPCLLVSTTTHRAPVAPFPPPQDPGRLLPPLYPSAPSTPHWPIPTLWVTWHDHPSHSWF